MTAADPRSEMLFEMGQCAYRLGKVFGAEAERAEAFERKLEYFRLFDGCFFAVRMSVALELRLRQAARAELRDGAGTSRSEFEAVERDPIERDPPETESYNETESERDRERERVSLPVLLRSLNQVVADASALPGAEPAALPTLRELLARVKADTAANVAARPPGGVLRTRLAASSTTPAFTLAGSAHPPPPGRRGALPLRPATGPPR